MLGNLGKIVSMAKSSKESMREWVNTWKKTGKLLEEIRRKEIRTSNLEQTILALNNAFLSAIWLEKPKKSSGLVEFHKILAKSL